jgi:monoamine oxidase
VDAPFGMPWPKGVPLLSSIVDVAVVGAGLSGLVSAYRLHQAGAEVLILEAKNRVGGRLMTSATGAGVGVDSGGSWIGPRHQAVLALLNEFDIDLVPQFTDGANLLHVRGRTYRYKGEVPRLRPHEMLDLARAQWALDRMAARLGSPPWPGGFAARLDERTLGAWMRRRVRTAAARLVLNLVTAASFGCRPEELSLLAFAAHVHGCGGLADLIGTSDGALANRILGGAAELPTHLARRLGDRVRLDHAVVEIRRSPDHVELFSRTHPPVCARRVVVAVDPATANAIGHHPPLPVERSELQRRWQMGSGIKAHVIYRRAWWRDQGLSGAAVTDTGTARLTFDVSPTSAEPGVLMAFLGVAAIDDPGLLQPDAATRRRQRVLDDLTKLFGPDAQDADEYVEQDWANEPWQSGCVPRVPAGVLGTGHPWLTRPVGPVHWAGAETSHLGEAHMDGAVRAGQRAAEDVLATLTVART